MRYVGAMRRSQPSVVMVVADGVRADTLRHAIDAGTTPALARLAAGGGMHQVTTVFPSVTGLAYAPFIAGRSPAAVGLPGLRWYDRTRSLLSFPHFTRSYMGQEMRHVDRDLDANVPTLFELAKPSLGAMTMIGRGLSRSEWIGRGARWTMRAANTHFRGALEGWLQIDRDIARSATERIRAMRPRFALLALLGIDKASHAEGHEGPSVGTALSIVDETVARLQDDAERDGWAEDLRLWVVSDHGHSPVRHHENLAGLVRELGYRVIAHPWIYSIRRPDIAVMVSGNAMAHLYVDLSRRDRPWWSESESRWTPFVTALLERESVDLLLLPSGPGTCIVHGRGRGAAEVSWSGGRYAYRTIDGNPLGIADAVDLDEDEAHAATLDCDYPDALVQIARVAGGSRSGDIILSAARDWDFRAHYEPIPHRSSHGALHRDHMMVPLLLDRPPVRTPRRTVELMASACTALGIPAPATVEGRSFY